MTDSLRVWLKLPELSDNYVSDIIIIIIKKVKIIVTLSIKNTAGALYKSQIKGKNRYCLADKVQVH